DAWLRAELARYEVDVPVRVLDERDAGALEAALADARPPRLVLLVGAGVSAPRRDDDEAVRVVAADTCQPEQVSRLFKALGQELARHRARPADGEASPAAS